MALNDNSVLVIGAGNYFTAEPGTPLPADLLNPDPAWEAVGHTSIEDILNMASEGGDEIVVSTLQNRRMRTKSAPRTETLRFSIHQFDTPGLRLYFGSNAPTLPDGTIGVPTNPIPTTKAFCAIFVDGESVFAVYMPKSEIFRAEDLSANDTENPATLPLAVKPIEYNQNGWAMAVTPLGDASGAGDEPVADGGTA